MAVGYLSLVHAHGGAALDPKSVEEGLATVASNISAYMAQGKQLAGTLLQRFVYSDLDRCSPKATCLAFEILKLLGRQGSDGGELSRQKAIDGILQIIQDQDADTRNEGLTCIANAMLLQPQCREYVADPPSIDIVASILQTSMDNTTTVFLCARCLLFALATAESARYCVEQLRLHKPLAQAAVMYLDREVAVQDRFTPSQVVAELLKAAMGMCTYYLRWIHRDAAALTDSKAVADDTFPLDKATELVQLLEACLGVLGTQPLSAHHLTDPAKQAIGIAMNFPTSGSPLIEQAWFPNGDMKYVDAIYTAFQDIVYQADVTGGESDRKLSDVAETYQSELSPLALALMRLVTEHPKVRQHIFGKVYPQSTIDFGLLPEDRPGLSAKLVRLMRNPHGGVLPTAIGDFILALLGHDIKQFVLAVGYGNAAGYMVARGIDIPPDIIQQVTDHASMAVDPVTGRRWRSEDINQELGRMTDEEKEREAERLFVLFERLNRTGVIKVENPVRAAAESGRLEEIDDSSSSDSK